MMPLLFIGAWEIAWWVRRQFHRANTFDRALAKARELKRPLCVIGAPDSGPTAGFARACS